VEYESTSEEKSPETGRRKQGRKPKSVMIHGRSVECHTWKAVLKATAEYASKRGRIPVPWKPRDRLQISRSLADFNERYRKSAFKLPNGAYLDTWLSAKDCVELARLLLKDSGLDENILVVE